MVVVLDRRRGPGWSSRCAILRDRELRAFDAVPRRFVMYIVVYCVEALSRLRIVVVVVSQPYLRKYPARTKFVNPNRLPGNSPAPLSAHANTHKYLSVRPVTSSFALCLFPDTPSSLFRLRSTSQRSCDVSRRIVLGELPLSICLPAALSCRCVRRLLLDRIHQVLSSSIDGSDGIVLRCA